jgi:hypothetical protein
MQRFLEFRVRVVSSDILHLRFEIGSQSGAFDVMHQMGLPYPSVANAHARADAK